jgi:dUTP pyrophosphatase
MKLKVKLTKGKNMMMHNKFDSGYDLLAKGVRRVKNRKLQDEMILEDGDTFTITPNETVLITTGVHLDLPEPEMIKVGVYRVIEAQLRGRSGMSLKTDTNVKLGTIDNEYTGEVGIIFHNESNQPQTFKKDDAIAQLVFNEIIKFTELEYVDYLSEKDRGDKGFGSTGINKG